MAEAGQNRPRHDSDALVGVSILHSAIMHDSLRTLENLCRKFMWGKFMLWVCDGFAEEGLELLQVGPGDFVVARIVLKKMTAWFG